MAPYCACATGRADAAYRRTRVPCRGRSGRASQRRSVRADFAVIGLDHRPQPIDRHSLGRGRHRELSQIRGGNGRACARCHPDRCQRSRGSGSGSGARGDPHFTNCVRERIRPSRRWLWASAKGYLRFWAVFFFEEAVTNLLKQVRRSSSS